MRNNGLDNLKIFLTLLVVFHHAAAAYTVGENWPVIDHNQTRALIPMLAINATFFMGLFFFIAGTFIPSSLEKYGTTKFIINKLYRLIVPVILISLFIPFFVYFLKFNDLSFYTPLNFYSDFFVRNFTFGHGWFLIHLFIFSCVYAFLKNILKKYYLYYNSTPEVLCLGVFLGSITYMVNIKFPINYWVLYHSFEIYHFPQYIIMFFLGIIYSNFHITLSLKQSIFYILFSVFLISLYILNFNYPFSLDKVEIWWSSALAIFLSLGLFGFFTNYITLSNYIIQSLARNSFGIYIVHVFIVIILQKLLLIFDMNPLFKFFIAGLTGYFVSFGIVAIHRFSLNFFRMTRLGYIVYNYHSEHH